MNASRRRAPATAPALAPALAVALATGLAAPAARADEAPARAPGRFGAVALETSAGRGITWVQGVVGRASGSTAEPLVARLGVGLSMGGGLWLDGTLRAGLEGELAGVRALGATAGIRVDSGEGAPFSLSFRFAYSALVLTELQHGGLAAAGLNVRPWRALALFVEGSVEAYPAAAFETTTANGQTSDVFALVVAASYLGGVRVSL